MSEHDDVQYCIVCDSYEPCTISGSGKVYICLTCQTPYARAKEELERLADEKTW